MSKATLPKGVWFTRKTLASGEVVRYGYYGRGPGMQALGKEGSPDFHLRLAEVIRKAPDDTKVSYLIWRYRSSDKFAKLAPRTRADYTKHLDRIQLSFGKMSKNAFEIPEISDRFYRWRDTLANDSPRQADYTISVLSAMLSWCVKRGLLSINRAAGIEDVYAANRSSSVWTDAEQDALMAVAAEPIRRASILALETGLSQEDLLVLPWSSVQGNVIVWQRLKNGTPIAVPISPALAACLAASPKGLPLAPILTKADGLPFRRQGQRTSVAVRTGADGSGDHRSNLPRHAGHLHHPPPRSRLDCRASRPVQRPQDCRGEGGAVVLR